MAGTALGFVTACAQPTQHPTDVSAAGAILVAAADGGLDADLYAPGGSGYGSYLAGLFAGRQQDLSVAADFMLDALAQDPDNPQLLSRAFMLVASDGRHDKSLELARLLNDAAAGNGLSALVIGVDAAAAGDFAAAEQALSEMPNRGLSTILGPLLMGWLRIGQEDLSGGLTGLAGLQNRDGFGVLYNLHAALMNDVAGADAEAATAYEAALEAAVQPSSRLVALAGNFFERSGQTARAAELYREFLDRNPDSMVMATALRRADGGAVPAPSVPDVRSGMAEALFNVATLLSQERAEEVALIHVHLTLRLRPEFTVARFLLGEVLQKQGRSHDAIEAYRNIPGDSPFSWIARLRTAEELEQMDRTEAAVAELEQLATLNPTRLEPLFRLGNLLRNRERFEEAVAAYDRAAELVAEPERRHWTLYYFRGIALERLSRWPRAEADFLLALELEPEQPFVMNYLAYSWVEKKLNLDEAKGMLARAVELRPDDGFIVDRLGWVHYRLGEYDQGVKFLERAVELRPQDPVINDHLGDAYWRVGRVQEARFQWRRALSLGPDADLVPRIESKIERGLEDTPEDI